MPSLLVIGTEIGVFDPQSPARERILAYARQFGETHIIVLCRGAYATERVGNATLHPTNSWTRALYGFDALRIARRLPRPDIVSVQDPYDSGMLGLLVARIRAARLHVQVHTDVFAASFRQHSLLNAVRAIVARSVFSHADGIRVVAEHIKLSIEKRLTPKRPIAVLPIYVDTEHFRHAGAIADPRFARFATKLLWVGRFEAEKDPLRALDAFASAAPSGACLIYLGEGALIESLRARAHELSVHDRVFFEGHQDPAPYYALADLVLVTSEYEGYSRVVVEALAAGRPVLSTDVGIAREAGARIAEGDFSEALRQWFQGGARSGELHGYPYRDFDDYVRQYCDDILRLV